MARRPEEKARGKKRSCGRSSNKEKKIEAMQTFWWWLKDPNCLVKDVSLRSRPGHQVIRDAKKRSGRARRAGQESQESQESRRARRAGQE